MPGNSLSLDQRLRNGDATGALILCVGAARFRVTVGKKGRSLVAARDVAKGETLCRLPGCLVDARTAPAGAEVFLVHKPRRRGAPARWLVLDPATASAPGNLANTSDGSDTGNNARLCYKRGSSFASLVAVRRITAGEEVLAPYGRGYTCALRATHASAAAPPPHPHPFAVVQCGACGAHMQHKNLAKHARGFACPVRRSPTASAPRPRRGDT